MTERNPSHEERIIRLESAIQAQAGPKTSWLMRNQVYINFVLVILAALFTVFWPQWKQDDESKLVGTIDKEIDHKLQEARINELTGEIKTMSGKLEEISGFLKIVVAKEMQNNSRLSPTEFEKQLPQVASTLEVARVVHSEMSPGILADLQTRLLSANQREIPFWLASSALVSLRSSNTKKPDLSNCISAYTNELYVTQGGTTSFSGIPLFRNCTLNLDIPTPKIEHPDDKKHVTGPDIACTNCRVIYSGGPIPSFQQGLKSVRFINCTFEISTKGVPPPYGRTFLLTLLRSADPKLINYGGDKAS